MTKRFKDFIPKEIRRKKRKQLQDKDSNKKSSAFGIMMSIMKRGTSSKKEAGLGYRGTNVD